MIVYDKACKICGHRLSEFYNTFMLGCPDCYKAFEPEINESLKKVQAQSFHTGKTPRIKGLDKELLDVYQRLLQEKEKAGIDADFKKMAELSAEIFDLKTELEQRGLL